MTDQPLFDVPESLSPRLAWIKKHKVTIQWVEEDDCFKAWIGNCCMDEFMGRGATEDDALLEMAQLHALKLWHEEGYKA